MNGLIATVAAIAAGTGIAAFETGSFAPASYGLQQIDAAITAFAAGAPQPPSY